jgi:CelD/BcsL family acetyltransferase involved in cellulose biosynthesis
MDVDVVRAGRLTAGDQAAWQAFSVAASAFSSPFLSPSFAQAVSQVRRDVWVAVGKDHHGPAAFWAFHRRPAGFLRPVGAPLSDVQGVVARPGLELDLPALLTASGGSVARFSALPDAGVGRGGLRLGRHDNWVIDLAEGGQAYLAQLKTREAKHLANTARCARKAEREIGPVQFAFQDRSRDALDLLIAWKRARFRETGKHDLFSAPWINGLFDVLWRWPDPDFGLVFSTVRFGDRLAAGEVYLRRGERLHAWISGFDRDLSTYAPGHILTARMIEQSESEGVKRIDFGVGSDEYKSKWCLSTEPLWEVAAHGAAPLARLRAAAFERWRGTSGGLGVANRLLTKARGRADHIFAAQGSWAGAGLALAITILGRRHGAL